MASKVLQLTRASIGILEKILRSNVRIYGRENVPKHPAMYVVNHFTRFETFVVPYVINKVSGRDVHSLAHDSLFKGGFGKFLTKVGCVSTGHPMRNRLIVGDLATGSNDWLIYPEGIMLKNKRVERVGKDYRLTKPGRIGPPHTGAAVLAMKAQYVSLSLRRALERQDHEELKRLIEMYEIEDAAKTQCEDIHIVPVTITYYPIRPNRHLMQGIVGRLAGKMPERVIEELEVESNLLLEDTDISIHFGPSINVADFISLGKFPRMLRRGVLKDRNIQDFQIRSKRLPLSRMYMERIYSNIRVNMDHVVCQILRQGHTDTFPLNRLYRGAYLAANRIVKEGACHIHRSLRQDLIHLVSGELYEPVQDVIQLATDEGALVNHDGELMVNREIMQDTHTFHDVRVRNTVRVLANEVEPVNAAMNVLRAVSALPEEELSRQIADTVAELDQELFESDYETYYDEALSKSRDVGRPFFLDAGAGSDGVLISHGYLASPGEARPLAEFLHRAGYSVYVTRMRGHGTAPRNLADVRWEDWYRSYLRGFAVLHARCPRMVIGGFSTGGVLALMKAAHATKDVKGIFSINAPMKLANIKTRFVPAVMFWNELLKRVRADDAILEKVDHQPENAETNYTQNYVRGLFELDQLMNRGQKALKNIDIPALIMQGDKDPAVKASSVTIIDKGLPHEHEVEMVRADRHVIIRGEGSAEVHARILRFVQERLP